jgi:hypothetical protein
MLSWTALLAWSAATGPVALLADKLGQLVAVPGVVFVGGTVILPFVLAFTAARVFRA